MLGHGFGSCGYTPHPCGYTLCECSLRFTWASILRSPCCFIAAIIPVQKTIHRIIIIFAVLALVSGHSAETKEILRLDVYPLDGMMPMPVHSIVTNVSDAPVTIPTRSYSDGIDAWATGGETVGIFFTIGFGSVGQYKLVPSPLRFAPVTLQPGESTELPVATVTLREEKKVKVVFVVNEDYARRHGWWFGTLKREVVIGERPNPYLVTAPDTPLEPPTDTTMMQP